MMSDAGRDDRVLWRDDGTHYGWISILAHWVAALVILTLLFIGDSIQLMGGRMVRLHVSIALLSYAFLAWRVGWRWRLGHPHARPGAGRLTTGLSKLTHHLLLGGICAMLLSGPAMACAGSVPLRLFDWAAIPCPPVPGRWFQALHGVHAIGARVIVYGVLLHCCAVLKHVVWNKDGTFGRMMTPRPGRSVEDALREDARRAEGL